MLSWSRFRRSGGQTQRRHFNCVGHARSVVEKAVFLAWHARRGGTRETADLFAIALEQQKEHEKVLRLGKDRVVHVHRPLGAADDRHAPQAAHRQCTLVARWDGARVAQLHGLVNQDAGVAVVEGAAEHQVDLFGWRAEGRAKDHPRHLGPQLVELLDAARDLVAAAGGLVLVVDDDAPRPGKRERPLTHPGFAGAVLADDGDVLAWLDADHCRRVRSGGGQLLLSGWYAWPKPSLSSSITW